MVSRRELYALCREKLEKAGIDTADFDAMCIFQDMLGEKNPLFLPLEEVPEDKAERIMELTRRRSERYPLQYLLGQWEFFGYQFFVGEGVLIPRPETEQLAGLALEYIREIKNPAVLDLCAGTGCIGLTIAKERPDSTVFLFEKYDRALDYLRRNTENLGAVNTRVVKGDIFKAEDLPCAEIDLIVSNPPYVPTGEIEGLEREVRREPETALDGGDDGLTYYYAIKEISQRLDAPVIVECGEGQADAVCGIFKNARACEDFNSIKRFVIGE